jgi:hypothetical protein
MDYTSGELNVLQDNAFAKGYSEGRKETLERLKERVPQHPKINGYDVHKVLDEMLGELKV